MDSDGNPNTALDSIVNQSNSGKITLPTIHRLVNSQSFAGGAQLTPNINAVSGYWSVVDYRLGANYTNTYLKINGTNINQYGISLGLGLPIPNERRGSYYKVNIAAEIGRRGTLDNSLVREGYFNLHIGFTINDKWFQKYKFD